MANESKGMVHLKCLWRRAWFAGKLGRLYWLGCLLELLSVCICFIGVGRD